MIVGTRSDREEGKKAVFSAGRCVESVARLVVGGGEVKRGKVQGSQWERGERVGRARLRVWSGGNGIIVRDNYTNADYATARLLPASSASERGKTERRHLFLARRTTASHVLSWLWHLT